MIPGQRLLKIKNQDRTTEEKIGAKKTLEIGFGNRSYTSAEKKPLASSFGEVGHKGQSTTRFNILNGLL